MGRLELLVPPEQTEQTASRDHEEPQDREDPEAQQGRKER
jgi:hypothetical protein